MHFLLPDLLLKTGLFDFKNSVKLCFPTSCQYKCQPCEKGEISLEIGIDNEGFWNLHGICNKWKSAWICRITMNAFIDEAKTVVQKGQGRCRSVKVIFVGLWFDPTSCSKNKLFMIRGSWNNEAEIQFACVLLSMSVRAGIHFEERYGAFVPCRMVYNLYTD